MENYYQLKQDLTISKTKNMKNSVKMECEWQNCMQTSAYLVQNQEGKKGKGEDKIYPAITCSKPGEETFKNSNLQTKRIIITSADFLTTLNSRTWIRDRSNAGISQTLCGHKVHEQRCQCFPLSFSKHLDSSSLH